MPLAASPDPAIGSAEARVHFTKQFTKQAAICVALLQVECIVVQPFVMKEFGMQKGTSKVRGVRGMECTNGMQEQGSCEDS